MTAQSNDTIDESSAPLIEHLAELRSRLIWSVLALLFGFALCFTIATPIFNWLKAPICAAQAELGKACTLSMLAPQEGFTVNMRLAMFGGFALAFPFIGYQLWRFVAPGLYRSEKKAFLPFLVASPAMFIAGASFAYYGILPLAFRFFLSYQQGVGSNPETVGGLADAGIVYIGSIDQYLSLTMKFIMAFGLCFQLPVLLTLMGTAGLISADALASTRRYAIVVILIACALISPPDVMSLAVMFFSVYPLYEVSIWLIRIIERRRAQAEDAAQDEAAPTSSAVVPGTSDKTP